MDRIVSLHMTVHHCLAPIRCCVIPIFAEPDAGLFGDYRNCQYGADVPSPGLILTLVGMYGLMFLTIKRRISRPGLSPHSPLPVFWLYPRTYSEHLSVCRNG